MTFGWVFFSFYPITVFPKVEGKPVLLPTFATNLYLDIFD